MRPLDGLHIDEVERGLTFRSAQEFHTLPLPPENTPNNHRLLFLFLLVTGRLDLIYFLFSSVPLFLLLATTSKTLTLAEQTRLARDASRRGGSRHRALIACVYVHHLRRVEV